MYLPCSDCDIDIGKYGVKEYAYKIHDYLWISIGDPQFLCIECLEKRLKRGIGPYDFDWYWPINDPNCKRSSRLIKIMYGNSNITREEMNKIWDIRHNEIMDRSACI